MICIRQSVAYRNNVLHTAFAASSLLTTAFLITSLITLLLQLGTKIILNFTFGSFDESHRKLKLMPFVIASAFIWMKAQSQTFKIAVDLIVGCAVRQAEKAISVFQRFLFRQVK